jgi:hypothetical protein
MASGKHAPEGKSRSSHECIAIDLEMKMRMIHKYEGGQRLSAIACELGFVVSSLNTIMKGTAMMKLTIIIAKKHEDVISEMEKLLTMCMEAHIQKLVPLSLMEVQAKTKTN